MRLSSPCLQHEPRQQAEGLCSQGRAVQHLAKQVANLAPAHANVAGGHVRVVPDVTVQLGHEGLTELQGRGGEQGAWTGRGQSGLQSCCPQLLRTTPSQPPPPLRAPS